VPLFLALLMGIADFGIGLKTWISMTNAAREAARYAAVNCAPGDASDSDVQQRAVDSATTLGLNTGEVTVENCTAGASAESVVVTIEHERQQMIELLVKTDPHSPDEFRVNGVVPNVDDFYATYGVKEGDKLFLAPADRVRIWQ
jgi:Flp pilus assembly protein TadG